MILDLLKTKGKNFFSFCLLIITLFPYLAFSQQVTGNQQNQLSVSPERCIALRKGQTCYQDVKFKWHTKIVNDYCLVNKTTNTTLKCWLNANSGHFDLDHQAVETHTFILKTKTDSSVLASVKITVAWVYNSVKRSKASWRLF